GQRALWDGLELYEVPAGSRTLEELPQLAEEAGFLVGLRRSADSPYLPLIGAWEGYLKGLKAKHRSNLRNRLKRLSEAGPVQLETVASSEQGLARAFEDGLQLEGAGWKGEAGAAIR